MLARTGKAASRLSAQFRAGQIAKVYWAIVEGEPADDHGEWIDLLKKDPQSNLVRVKAAEQPDDGGKKARVVYRVVARCAGVSKLELRPATGRSHQLRVQLANRGMPIVGDRKYRAATVLKAEDGGHRIALHARQLSFKHPTREEVISVVAPVPADWPGSWPGV